MICILSFRIVYDEPMGKSVWPSQLHMGIHYETSCLELLPNLEPNLGGMVTRWSISELYKMVLLRLASLITGGVISYS